MARAFAAEILAGAAEDGEDARRRALLDPSPHPDLVWLAPKGAQHMVEEVRERVIRASAYRPYEGGKRVFVIEAAEAMRDESQNALLKTLEEPPEFVHLILLTSEPAALLETIASRCQPVDFAPAAAPRRSKRRCREDADGRRRCARRSPPLARLAAGDPASWPACCWSGRARLAGQLSAKRVRRVGPDADWRALLKSAEQAGEEAEAAAREALEADKEAGVKRSARDIADAAKRAGRRRRTELLDLGLSLAAAWFRDLAAVASGAADVAYNRDRLAAAPVPSRATSTPTAPAAPPSWSRTPAAASTSTSPRS